MNGKVRVRVALILVGVILLNVAWFLYVRSEQTIYSWDYDGYWAMCGRLQQRCAVDPVKFVRDVLGSVRDAEYTGEPVAPAAVAITLGQKLHLFGFSRASYIMANGTLYMVPALLLMIWLVAALRSSSFRIDIESIPTTVWVAGVLMALLTPALWLPLYRGYPDGGGLIFCFLITALFMRWRQERRGALDELLSWSAMVVLLVGLVYFRRWYMYWILWFWLGAGLICVWDAWDEWRRGTRGWDVLRNSLELGAGGVAFCALVFVVSHRFVRQILFYNFADRYSAFRVSRSFGEFLGTTFAAPGLVVIALFLAGCAYALLRPNLRKFAVLQIVQLIGVVIQFGRTQDLGPHHHYLLLALMLPLSTLMVAEWLQKSPRSAAPPLIASGLTASILSFTSLWPGAPRFLFPLTGAVDGAPLRRADIAEWRRMGVALDEILRSRGEGMIYVLGNSTTVNSSDFLSLGRSLNANFVSPKFVYYSHDIDKRDGFPVTLLQARYVIVADPIQVQFDPAEQQVVAAPEQEFLAGSGISAAFNKLPYQFSLDGGVKVYVFEKTRDIRPEELRELSDELRKAHPDRPYIYEPPSGTL